MKIDRTKPIAGLKPALLKKLLKEGSFSTPKAMDLLDLEEPTITNTLLELAKDGWIEFVKNTDHVDFWEKTEKGQRLLVTNLLKRISREEGAKIIDALLADVRRVNADPLYSYSVSQILLFGSMRSDRKTKSVGDIDLVVYLARRKLSVDQQQLVRAAEEQSAPARLGFLGRLAWPQERILVRLKKVSRYISFHADSDLFLGAPYQEIYAFDVEQNVELPPDSAVRRRKRSKLIEQNNRDVKEVPLTRPDCPARPWPKASEPRVAFSMGHRLGKLLQHLWRNGLTLKEINGLIAIPERTTEAYLASRAEPRLPIVGRPSGSLAESLLAVLPAERHYFVDVQVTVSDNRTDFTVAINKPVKNNKSILLAKGNAEYIEHAEPQYARILEVLSEVTQEWARHVRKGFKGLSVKVVANCAPSDTLTSSSAIKTTDLQSLRSAMSGALEQLWTAPYKGLESADLSVSFLDESHVMFSRNYKEERLVQPEQVALLTKTAEALRCAYPGVFKDPRLTWKIVLSSIKI